MAHVKFLYVILQLIRFKLYARVNFKSDKLLTCQHVANAESSILLQRWRLNAEL